MKNAGTHVWNSEERNHAEEMLIVSVTIEKDNTPNELNQFNMVFLELYQKSENWSYY